MLHAGISARGLHTHTNTATNIALVCVCLACVRSLCRKGRGGTVAVMGGSTVYSGAPFIASVAALRAGAELVYLHTEASAAAAIKSMMPDLCVHPSWRGSPSVRCVGPCTDSLVALWPWTA